MRFLSSRILWHSRLCYCFKIKTPRYTLRFYPSSVSTAMFCNSSFFLRDEMLLTELLRPGDMFVDVGANVGTLSLFASKIVSSEGRVIAIEAHPKTFKYLCGNIKLNKAANVIPINAAVGDRTGNVFFSDKRSDDQNSICEAGISVPLKTLSSLVIEQRRIRLLKIDVEGFELPVLRGARELLHNTDYVYFEAWEKWFNRFSYTTKDLIAYLQDCGFNVPVPANYISERCENFLATNQIRTEILADQLK